MANQQRIGIMDAAIAQEVRSGQRVESRSDYQAVLVRGHRVNHVLHLILFLVTLGLWLPIWILLAILGGEKRELLQVDAYGKMAHRKV